DAALGVARRVALPDAEGHGRVQAEVDVPARVGARRALVDDRRRDRLALVRDVDAHPAVLALAERADRKRGELRGRDVRDGVGDARRTGTPAAAGLRAAVAAVGLVAGAASSRGRALAEPVAGE